MERQGHWDWQILIPLQYFETASLLFEVALQAEESLTLSSLFPLYNTQSQNNIVIV